MGWHGKRCSDTHFQRFITDGIQQGFSIGFEPSYLNRSSKRNMKSAYEHTEVAQEYLDNEVLLQHVYEPGAKEAS